MKIKMPLKNQIKYRFALFGLLRARTYRRSKLCLQFLRPVLWLTIPWAVLLGVVWLFEKTSLVCILYEAKYDIFTSVVLAAVSVLTIKIPQYKMYLKRRYSLWFDVNMSLYSLRGIFEKEELDIVKLSNEIDNLKEIYEKIKQLRIESETFISEQERKEFKWLAERFFSELLSFESSGLFEKKGQEIMQSVLIDLEEYLNFLWTQDREVQRRILRIIKDYCPDWEQMADFHMFAHEEEFKTN